MSSKALWREFLVEFDDGIMPNFSKCGLCDNTGLVALEVTNARSGKVYQDNRPCICPNGRVIRREHRRRERRGPK